MGINIWGLGVRYIRSAYRFAYKRRFKIILLILILMVSCTTIMFNKRATIKTENDPKGPELKLNLNDSIK